MLKYSLVILILAAVFTLGCNEPEADSSAGKDFIAIGDTVPDFKLPGFPIDEFRMSDYRGKQAVVLYFYPKDNTPDCTKQACAFRDASTEFGKNSAVIFGVSQDDKSSHELFADEFDLPFTLLTDRNNNLRQQFGNPDGSTPLDNRITYVIDRSGVVREVIQSRDSELTEHISKSLAAVIKLNKSS